MRNINKERERNKQEKKRNKRIKWKKYWICRPGKHKKNRRTAQKYETEIEISAINCHKTLPYNM